jgi:hypothetical protein
MPEPTCACGLPLHYQDLKTKALVDRLVARQGPFIIVHVGAKRYRVQCHYIALHGLRARDLPDLVKRGIVEEQQ